MKKIISCAALALLVACQPTVKIETSDKPIVVDLNVKIEHTVKVQIDRDLDKAMKKNSDIF